MCSPRIPATPRRILRATAPRMTPESMSSAEQGRRLGVIAKHGAMLRPDHFKFQTASARVVSNQRHYTLPTSA
jgi:hypothetical protein